MRLYFIRHGESEANVLKLISNRGRQHGLTARGLAQAAALAAQLRSVPLAAVYTSPLLRAEQTAARLAAACGLAAQTTGALREYDCGVLEGRSDPAAWLQHETALVRWLRHGDHDYRPEQGESFNDIRARFVPFVEGLVEGYSQAGAGVALVGHGGLFSLMLPLVLDNLTPAFALDAPLPNTGVIRAELRAGRLVCVDWCGQAVG